MAARECVIRKARPDDLESLAALGRLTFATAYTAIVPPDDLNGYLEEKFAPELLSSEMRDPKIVYLVAAQGDRLAGYIKLSPTPPPEPIPKQRVIEVVRLYVELTSTGSGIGSLLLRAAWREAVGRGYSRWWLRVWKGNQAAVRFYKRFGFLSVTEEPYCIKQSLEPVLLMLSDLD